MAKGEARNFNQLHRLLVHLGAATVAQTTSLRYEPVSIRIGGSAKMRPSAMVLEGSVSRCYESSF